MNWRDRCIVVIPCLNEAKAIGPLIREIRNHLPNVLVVDDGSSDETGGRAESAGARVLRHDKTGGKGAALTTGFRAAVSEGFGWALILDGDGQHSPSDIPAFLDMAENEHATILIGNRMTGAGRMPWLRFQVNRWMSQRLSELAGCPLADSQCGFRLMNLDVWAELPIQSRHFEIESDLIIHFAWAGQPIRFVPIEVIYKDEQSKINPVSDTIRWMRWWMKTRREWKSGRHTQRTGLPTKV